MAEIGKAYVQVIPSARGIKGNLEKVIAPEADRAGVSAGGAITGKIKGLIAKAAIGTTIAAGIKKSISEGAALEQSMGGIETLFKKNANTVIGNAKKAYRTAGMSANEYMENVTSFSAGLIKSVGGDTAKAAKSADMAMIDMSDNANKMGTSMEDIQHAYQGFAKQNYTMLDNLKLGYGGTKEEMQRLLTDAEKITGQKYDMSNLNDVYNAIHVIQKDIGITGTTAKEAEHTIAGSFNSMKAAATDFMGQLAIGGDVSTPLKALISSASTFMGDNLLPAVGNIIKAIPTVVVTAAQTIGPKILPAGQKIIKYLFDGMAMANGPVDGILNKITAMLPGVLEQGKNIILKLGNGIINGLPGFINAIAQIIPKFVNFFAKNWPKIIKAGYDIVVNLAKGLIRNLPAILSAMWNLLKALVSAIIKYRATIFKTSFSLAKSMAKGLGGAALGLIRAAGKAIVKALTKALKTGIKAVQGIIKSIGNVFKKLPSTVKSIVKTVARHMGFSGLVSKVKGVWNRVKDAVTGPFKKAKETIDGIVDKIKSYFPINIGKMITGSIPKIDIGEISKKVGKKVAKAPKFIADWIGLAKGGIVTRPTVIAGEGQYDEAVLPLTPFWNKMEKFQSQNRGVTYNIGDITLDASNLEDVATIEDFVDVLRRAKAFA